MVLADLFDAYSLQARLQPALLTLAPAIFILAVWYPQQYATGVSLVGIAVSCGLVALLAHLSRQLGRRAERKLLSEWGGKPTTLWLRHRDNRLEGATKLRYRAFFRNRIPGWTDPTPKEESENPANADALYDSAVKWLLEYTRDAQKFPLIFKENVAYGFRRNLYGLRPIGFFVAFVALSVGINEQLIYFRSNSGEVNVIGALVVGVCVVMLFCWLFIITSDWVKDAADSYARALLAVCDAPGN